MILKNYKYINLAYFTRYLIFLVFILKPLLLKEGTFMISVYTIISFFLIFATSACDTVIEKELIRRMSKIPVPKNKTFKWHKNSNVGYAFTDLSKGTIWICGTQTKFELHVYLLSEFKITESLGKIQFKKYLDTIRENELQEFVIYTL